MNNTPRGNRLHIALFGKRNAGKSSLINALTNQKVAIVSEVPGTTTDPVYKTMEILPLGPVVLIDTPGIDDEGTLGELRVNKTKEVLRKTDIAILVTTCDSKWGKQEEELISRFKKRNLPFIIAVNKCEKKDAEKYFLHIKEISKAPVVKTSALTGEGIEELIKELVKLKKEDDQKLHLIDGLVKAGDLAVLVTPIDEAAPKGRLILPQQQVLRDILDNGAMALVVKETELEQSLKNLSRSPDIVITDSKVFDKVSKIVPEEIPLTSFSIIYARHKGNLDLFYKAVREIENLKDGDYILMAEGCTHHRKDDDIGTVKIPDLIKKKTGKQLNFHHVSGAYFKEDISKYRMVIHCGACMLNKREMEYRQMLSLENGIPMINYGIVLAYLNGIIDRAMKPFINTL
ncbi:[FeFe] hydrogenase H-cluster maturation GTPase HydF [Acetivibrio saccincola]|jgi:[FeFe] hydrogenase H-cluster maturation GTPase HydF|uniref:GTPase Era n=1 Tax=Acetivibrio saccincola TaxID=1677857 RepID=A0A2K9ES93_9FIRM|nr:[FeFe] hydrogenase H-cluster maturation GTPase HydF [Acetivibrio saccincola]AUG58410.1 GTPase Era [Acetivibrio saccincola]NLW27398.1 [FeFe] hydrogenase H-cluster maturation GTPase HydF [Acetivibrio saccincola]PQQ66382.1 [FeFe] hydrogenase H-cluster maturation GTPase HydF [Acetivibrio saccincola]HOA98081.1 [FeFe] hydrogenase H-cluster maturation GTPase HydF [Acetivibrio saccincola]HQD29864.1 [FeFe] hydrogenase H-cluster maturation GTPase HydF [Acetivibrio saccincola]